MKTRYPAMIAMTAAASLSIIQADAAVTVLGNGLARSCFEHAEFGGNAKDGIDACTGAIEETAIPVRDLAATYINRGILKSRTDNTNGAVVDYDKGLSLDAALGEGYVDRGAVMIVLRRYEDALADIDKGIALGSNRLQIAYYDRAIVHEALGNIRDAYEDYRKAAEIQPDFALALQELARFRVVRKSSDGT
ncbi:MAG TPA: tetratricopeptide repeat protein [Rhizomicrobium sp.]